MNNVYELRTHRVDYACAVVRPEPATWRDWAAVAVAYSIGAVLFVAGFMAGRWALNWLGALVGGV